MASKYPEVVKDMRSLIEDLKKDMRPAFLPNRQKSWYSIYIVMSHTNRFTLVQYANIYYSVQYIQYTVILRSFFIINTPTDLYDFVEAYTTKFNLAFIGHFQKILCVFSKVSGAGFHTSLKKLEKNEKVKKDNTYLLTFELAPPFLVTQTLPLPGTSE